MVNLLRGAFGGVGAVEDLGTGSLILMPPGFLPTTFLAFFWRGGVAEDLHFPTRVLNDTTLAPVVESPSDSPLGDWVKIRITRISMSPSKPGMREMKLSKTCKQIHQG
jgi:hypothetical protein